MSAFIVFWVLFGLAIAVLEHRLFNLDFEDCSKRDIAFMVAQQVIHYVRIVAVWPLYVVEELVIRADNRGRGEE